jgi:hypothetical protein
LCDLEKYSDSDYFFSWSEKLNMLNSCNGLESEVLIVQKVSHPAVKNPIILIFDQAVDLSSPRKQSY